MAPKGLRYVPGPGAQVQLHWSDASFNEVGFAIERAPRGTGSFARIVSARANSVQATDSLSCAFAASYDYRVRAFNSSGASAPTNTASTSTSSWLTPGR